jgi:hypothetical protein
MWCEAELSELWSWWTLISPVLGRRSQMHCVFSSAGWTVTGPHVSE